MFDPLYGCAGGSVRTPLCYVAFHIKHQDVKVHFETQLSEIGFKILRKSAVGFILLGSTTRPFEWNAWQRLRGIAFDREDIVELVFVMNGQLQIVRLKKMGNKTLGFMELKNAVAAFG